MFLRKFCLQVPVFNPNSKRVRISSERVTEINLIHLIQKGNIKPSESIITATEDINIGQNALFNLMANKKHN